MEATKKQRILILDDEIKIVDILQQHLSEEGYACSGVTNPHEALKTIANEPIDLLIADVKMPEMDGIQVLKEVRRINQDIAVVVITAYMDVSDAIQAIRAGANDYVLKPFNLGEISMAISQALEKRRLLIENRKYQHVLEKRVHDATKDIEAVNA